MSRALIAAFSIARDLDRQLTRLQAEPVAELTSELAQRAPMIMKNTLVLAALALSACASVPKAPAPPCPSPTEAMTAVPEALRQMYAALTADDEAGFMAVLADDFYAYDLGKRFSAAELFAAIKTAHAGGKRFVWTVQEPDTHVACALAWVAYVNRGSLTDGTGEHPLAWLESAAVVHEKGAWRVRFFHSTRVPSAP